MLIVLIDYCTVSDFQIGVQFQGGFASTHCALLVDDSGSLAEHQLFYPEDCNSPQVRITICNHSKSSNLNPFQLYGSVL